ncbi:MAG: DNA-3-methyladenine glycosylase [Bacteroidota bacterium]
MKIPLTYYLNSDVTQIARDLIGKGLVTNVEGIPHAVLVRALYPLEGIGMMQERIGRNDCLKKLAYGPGKLSKALGIHFSESGISLNSDFIWLEDRSYVIPSSLIISGKRIGVDYAGSHADWLYRFYIKGNNVDLSGLCASG